MATDTTTTVTVVEARNLAGLPAGAVTVEFNLKNIAKSSAGEFVDSRPFRAAGHEWFLRFYPCGIHKKDHGRTTSLFLHAGDAAAAAVDVLCDFRVATPDGKEIVAVGRGGRAEVKGGGSWGFANFVAVDEMKKRFMGKDGFVRVICTVTVVSGAGKSPAVVGSKL